jgi:Fungal N-terminal domain of STAND proteins
MADPLSIVTSVIGIVAFAAQVGSSIKDFTDSYRGTDLELTAIVAELSTLSSVLTSLQAAYGEVEELNANGAKTTSKWKPLLSHQQNSRTVRQGQADRPLKEVLDGLNRSMKQLDDVVKRSGEQMAKGGLYKVRVKALWLKTAKGIEKVKLFDLYHSLHQ